MIRKQLYLPEELERRIQLQAKIDKKSEAQVIRELLQKGFTLYQQEKPRNAGEALLGLAELGEKLGLHGPTDLSSRIDEILYGDESA